MEPPVRVPRRVPDHVLPLGRGGGPAAGLGGSRGRLGHVDPAAHDDHRDPQASHAAAGRAVPGARAWTGVEPAPRPLPSMDPRLREGCLLLRGACVHPVLAGRLRGRPPLCRLALRVQCAAYQDEHTPTGYYAYPRSSVSKTPLRLANSVGIIDSGYRGNLMGAFDCHLPAGEKYTANSGVRLVQICAPDLMPFLVKVVDKLDDTTRGAGGFGSTGV